MFFHDYRHQHPIQFSVLSFVFACVSVVAVVVAIGHYSTEAAKLNAEKEIRTSEIHEREETERTEERSQFWQKLVPWGSDETEESK